MLLGWSASSADADQAMFPVFESTQWPPNSNRALYKNATVDQLLQGMPGRKAKPAKRAAEYKEAPETHHGRRSWILLLYPKQCVAYRAGITGIEVLPTEHVLFARTVKP